MAKARAKKTRKGESLPGEIVGEMNGFPVRRLNVNDLNEADYNPREISDEALSGLQASVDTFGLVTPIIWNKRTGRIVGGHQRLKTLAPNSNTDVVEVDLDPAKEVALNLSLNNPHTQGEWTKELGKLIDQVEADLPDLSDSLNIDDLNIEFDRVISVDLGPIGEFDDGEETPGSSAPTRRGNEQPENGPSRNHTHSMGWKLEVVFDKQETRDEALKTIRSLPGETLADKLEALVKFYKQNK